MTRNQLPAPANTRRSKFSVRWFIGISALLVGALMIFAVSRTVPVSPIASSSTWVRITGLQSERFDEEGQSLLDYLRAHPNVPTDFAFTAETNYVERTLEHDSATYTRR